MRDDGQQIFAGRMMELPRFSRIVELVVLVLPLVVLTLASLALGAGLTYTLDDPYIHLAMARNIHDGHYGINAGEMSSPSSSILWPFLLAPFSGLAGFEHLPFVLNAAFASLSVLLLRDFLVRELGSSLLLSVAVLALGLGLNIYGLVFTGMEHSLQVLIVVWIAGRLCRNAMDRYFWLGIALLPLVRYEGLAISLPICVYGWRRGHRRAAGAAAAAILLLCGGFSAFLVSHGLPFLPMSVIVKGNFGGVGDVLRNAIFNVVAQPVLAYVVVRLTIYLFKSRRNAEAHLVLASSILFYAFGQCGWFGRYEVFFLAFVLILALHWWFHAWRDHPEKRGRPLWLLLPAILAPVAFASLPMATLTTPLAAKNIHDQQLQMGAIVRRLGAPVAVNDIGAVSFYGEGRVLDLWGLSSLDALGKRHSDPSNNWIADLMARRSVEFALIYDEWIDPRPSHWLRVGELDLPGRRITPAFETVAIYATNEQAAARMRSVLSEYRNSSPLAASITRIF